MSCVNCLTSKKLPLCINQLVIGSADPNTIYIVHFRNTNTNRLDILTVESDSSGLIAVQTQDLLGNFLSQNFTYKISIRDSEGIDDVEISFNEEDSAECVYVEFDNISAESATITIDHSCDCND